MIEKRKKALTSLLTVISLCFITMIFIGASSFYVEKKWQEIWSRLGLTSRDGDNDIKYSLINAHFDYTGAKLAAHIGVSDRNQVIKELAAYAKNYSRSAPFLQEYKVYRETKKPAAPQPIPGQSPDEIRAAEKLRLERMIKQQEANAKSDNEKLRNSVQYALPKLQKELSEVDDPNNKVINQRIESAKKSAEYGNKLYQDALTKWETEYPSRAELLVKKRLQQMLDLTADVDYDAELKDLNSYKVFVNPAYEKKPKEWKLAFRAGKSATETLRAIAQQWLQEIN